MKAVILAGGLGTRLREISGGLPKPMMPLLGKPLLEHIVALLREQGVREICMTLHYRPEVIRDHFGDGGRFGVSIRYREEADAPLGTAGAVRNCRDLLGDEDTLVLSGDGAFDFDLSPLAAAHRGGVTLGLTSHGEPLPYGLVLTDPAGQVTGFLEKPAWERVVTDRVNTGIYLLSPPVLDRIPPDRPWDFARDLFPRLLAEGVPLTGVMLEGYWCDIGTPRAYYQCNLDALDGRLRLPGGDGPVSRVLPCRDRARLMGALSRRLAEMAADFSDGLTVEDDRGRARLHPLADRCALAIDGDGPAVRALEALARQLEREELS